MSQIQYIYLPSSKYQVAVHIDGPENGPPVLLAHAILSSSVLWIDQALMLATKGYRVIRPDTRGHGLSQAPSSPYDIHDLATDVVEILDALGIARVHYVGLSLGGMCGFALAERHVHRLLSLCLCDCRADAPAEFAAPWDARIEAVKTQGCEVLAGPTVDRWLGENAEHVSVTKKQALIQAAATTSVDGMIGCARAIQGLDCRDSTKHINVPTLLIAGENDGGFPAALEELCAEIAGATLVVIPQSGHLPPIDQPDHFNAALLSHLKDSCSAVNGVTTT